MANKTKTDLESVEKKLLKEFGEGVIQKGADQKSAVKIPTGIISVDSILGGGVPKRRITEIFGSPSSGKTLLSLCVVANAQRMGDPVVFIDLERTYDKEWAALHGVDNETLRVVKPSCGEEAYEILEMYADTGEVGVIVVDSVANLVPRAELEGGVGDATIGLQARLNAKAMRRITNKLDTSGSALIFINQLRSKVSTGPFQGNPDTTTGGRAIPFYASLRLNLRRVGWVKSGSQHVGARFRMRVDKSKVTGTSLYGLCEFQTDFERGVDFAYELLQHGLEKGWVEKAGSWYNFEDDTSEQGERAAKDYMMESGLIEEWRNRLLREAG